MKKSVLPAVMLLACLSVFSSHTHLQAQSVAKSLTISISGIEYDDPHLVTLKESLRRNTKVKSLKPSYSSGVAKLSFTYNGEASQLWDELPKTSKQPFRLNEMSDNSISLNHISAQKPSTGSAQQAAGKKDCGDCEYFPLCNYDGTRSFQGKVFRKIDYDDGPVYYNCENGVVTKKWENISVDADGYKQSEGYLSMVILKSNAPAGTKWSEKFTSTGLLFNSTVSHDFEIISKGDSYKIDGRQYSDVIVVKETEGITGSLNYYAKGYGLVATEDLSDKIMQDQFGLGNQAGDELTRYSWQLNTPLDEGVSKGKTMIVIITFKEDGTYTRKVNFTELPNGDYKVNNTFRYVGAGGLAQDYWKRTKKNENGTANEYIEVSTDRFSWSPLLQITKDGLLDVEDKTLKFERVPLNP